MTLFSDSELMYDCTPPGVNAIPANAPVVAGYIDGFFQSYPLLVRRFSGRAHIVTIGTQIGNLAEVTDVEEGNPINTPALVRADFEHKKAHGVWRPCYYAPLEPAVGMLNTVLPGLSGIPRSEYRLWLADWDGNESVIPLPGGAEAAKQFRANVDGGLYDISVINKAQFLGQRHKPIPAPHPISPHDREENAEFNKWWNQGFHVGFEKGFAARLPLHAKAIPAISATAVGTGIVAALAAAGVHMTPTEAGGIVAGTSVAAGVVHKAVSRG